MSLPKLSEAIRLGAMLRPQGIGERAWPYRSCALQAALEAVGEPGRNKLGFTDYATLECLWPALAVTAVNPVSGRTDSLLVVIYQLNDSHVWTRERIADFVATKERELGLAAPVAADTQEVAHGRS